VRQAIEAQILKSTLFTQSIHSTLTQSKYTGALTFREFVFLSSMTSRAMAKREKMAGTNATLSDTERSGEDAQAETTQALPAEQVVIFFFIVLALWRGRAG